MLLVIQVCSVFYLHVCFTPCVLLVWMTRLCTFRYTCMRNVCKRAIVNAMLRRFPVHNNSVFVYYFARLCLHFTFEWISFHRCTCTAHAFVRLGSKYGNATKYRFDSFDYCHLVSHLLISNNKSHLSAHFVALLSELVGRVGWLVVALFPYTFNLLF